MQPNKERARSIIYIERVCVHERGRGRERAYMEVKRGQGYSHAPHDLFPRRSTAYHLSTYVDLKSMHVNPTDYVRRSMDYAHRSRFSATASWLLYRKMASLSCIKQSSTSARRSLMQRISIFACKLSVVYPYVKGPPDSSSKEYIPIYIWARPKLNSPRPCAMHGSSAS